MAKLRTGIDLGDPKGDKTGIGYYINGKFIGSMKNVVITYDEHPDITLKQIQEMVMADKKKKQQIPGEQVKAIGSKARHVIDTKKAGELIKERIKTKEA